jgi:diguanylate cyclase (GGDEF)-like protein/PAS domain S-box-containing protein
MPLKILLLEDSPADAELELREIRRAGIEVSVQRVEDAQGFQTELERFAPDVILSDYSLPQYDGLAALALARRTAPHTPFIFVSATIGEETAIESLRQGATDYVLKSNLGRLAAAVQRSVQEAAERRARAQAEEALRKSNERFQLAALATNDALWDWDLATDEVWWNDSFHTSFGYRPDSVQTRVEFRIERVHPDDRERVAAGIRIAITSGKSFWCDEYRFLRGDGKAAYVLDRAYVMRGPGGEALRMIGAMMDITSRKHMEEALQLSQRAIEVSVNPIIITSDPASGAKIVYVNPAFERLTGYSAQEVNGRNCSFLQGKDRSQPELEKVRLALREGRECNVLLRNYRKDQTLFWNDLHLTPVRDQHSGAVTHYVGVQHDVTQSRRYAEELEHQANHDALTGLANRNLLRDRLEQALVYSQRHGRLVMVAFVDLDDFKLINDSLGHSAGDRLLRIISERLQSCVRKGDTVSRLGGDEFVLILSDQGVEDSQHGMMERVITAVSEPCVIDGQELRVTCSIGISVYPHDARDAETLLRMADTAMYRAKDLGRNNFQFHTKELTARISERLSLDAGLRRALDRGELFLNYQPQFDLATGQVIGMEALIRWDHPERGVMLPAPFINLAEDNGLIVPIGAWVIHTACRHNKLLQDAGIAPIKVAVNLSVRQFRQKGLVKAISAIMSDIGLQPQYLELELTESMVMHSADEVIRTLWELQHMGVQLSVDDFGTGYSSLSYLKRFPVQRLKIDKSFVRDIGADADDTAIVQSVVALGHALKMKVVAEGVETEEQRAFLEASGCDEAQGFHLAKPMPFEEIVQMLRSTRLEAGVPAMISVQGG